jgi:hypothetical protein
MKISIDGRDYTDTVSVDDDWTRSHGGHDTYKTYELKISRADVQRAFSSYYEDYVRDSKAHAPEQDEQVALDLAKAGWPPFDQLMAKHVSLFQTFIADVSYDFVHAAVVAKQMPLGPLFFIRSVDEVILSTNELMLRGAALDWRQTLLNKANAKMPPGEIVPPEQQPGFMSNYDIDDEDDD